MAEYLTQQQLSRLRDIARAPRDHLLIMVQYETGCTVSELVRIRREDVYENTIIVHQRKCFVSHSLLRLLHKYLQTHDSPYLFPTRQSLHLTEKRVQQLVKKYLRRLGAGFEKATPQVLRYTHVAHALAQRIPLKDIMSQTGLGELRMAQLATELGPSDDTPYGGMFS